MLERARDFLVLIVSVLAQAFRTLGSVLLPQFGRIKAQLFGSWNPVGFCFHYDVTHNMSTTFEYDALVPKLPSVFVIVSDDGSQLPSSTAIPS